MTKTWMNENLLIGCVVAIPKPNFPAEGIVTAVRDEKAYVASIHGGRWLPVEECTVLDRRPTEAERGILTAGLMPPPRGGAGWIERHLTEETKMKNQKTTIYRYECIECHARGTMHAKRPPRACKCCPGRRFRFVGTDVVDDDRPATRLREAKATK